MKKSIIGEAQIVKAIKESEGGRNHEQSCLNSASTNQHFIKAKEIAGMNGQELKRPERTGRREPQAQAYLRGTGTGQQDAKRCSCKKALKPCQR